MKRRSYDTEIEYLGGDGTQYIDTGVVPDSSLQLHIVSRRPTTGNVFYPFGCIASDNSSALWFGVHYDGHFLYKIGTTQSTKWPSGRFYTGAWFNTIYSNNRIDTTLLDGTRPYNMSGTTPSVNRTLRLFSVQGLSGQGAGDIKSVIISLDGKVVRNFVPVRLGQVGYLFDKANPKGGLLGNGLYPNLGSGSFTLGDDV